MIHKSPLCVKQLTTSLLQRPQCERVKVVPLRETSVYLVFIAVLQLTISFYSLVLTILTIC
jgi:hypothetical protein